MVRERATQVSDSKMKNLLNFVRRSNTYLDVVMVPSSSRDDKVYSAGAIKGLWEATQILTGQEVAK